MYQLRTEIEIEATPRRVWEVLTDGDGYKEWNPFVRRLRGKLDLGEDLFVILTPPGRKAFVVRPKVVAWEQEKELAWRGKTGVSGLFDGEHHFEVHPIDETRSRFVQWERFSGLLVPLMKKMLDGSTKEGFIAMNQALKRQAEETEPPN